MSIFGSDVLNFVGNTLHFAENFISDSMKNLGLDILNDFLGENNWRIRAKIIFSLL